MRSASEGLAIIPEVDAIRADLGILEAGSKVSVDISGPANVRLMVAECAVLRQFGYGYLYYGGLYGSGTVTLPVPETDHWVLDVDLERLLTRVSISPIRIARR